MCCEIASASFELFFCCAASNAWRRAARFVNVGIIGVPSEHLLSSSFIQWIHGHCLIQFLESFVDHWTGVERDGATVHHSTCNRVLGIAMNLN